MKKAIASTILAIILAAAMALPAMAENCDGDTTDTSTVTMIDLGVDCDGWRACISVYFDESVQEVNLDWAVALIGDDGEPLEHFAHRVAAVREGTEAETVEFCFADTWVDYHDNPPFQVAVAAALECGEPISVMVDVDCAVANDEGTWDQVKSFYR